MVDRDDVVDIKLELERYFKGSVEEVIAIQKKLGKLGIRKVTERTPRDTDHLLKLWKASFGTPTESVEEIDDPVAAADMVIDSISELGELFLVNNEIYALVWELGGFVPRDPGPSKDPRPGRKGKVLVSGGYSTQSPKGMVGITVLELEQDLAAEYGKA